MRITKTVTALSLVSPLLVVLAGQATEDTTGSVSLTTQSEAYGRESGPQKSQVETAEMPLGQLSTADVEYAPFPELVPLSSGALVGIVTVVTEPTLNLPPDQSPHIHGDIEFPFIYSKATITVLQWIRNTGEFRESQVTVITEGGEVSRILTPDEVRELEDRHPGTVESRLVTTGYSIGDAQFAPGETVALLLQQADFGFVSGTERVPRVTGGAAGKFTVGNDGALYSAVPSPEHDPRSPATLQDFEAMVEEGIEN